MQLDWICLGLVAFMVSWGWLKGGLLQLARLVSLALAAGATVWAEPIVTDLVRAQFGERLPHPSLVAMGLTFGVVFLALHLTVGGYIKTLIHESGRCERPGPHSRGRAGLGQSNADDRSGPASVLANQGYRVSSQTGAGLRLSRKPHGYTGVEHVVQGLADSVPI